MLRLLGVPMFCHNCGTALVPQSSFCRACGARTCEPLASQHQPSTSADGNLKTVRQSRTVPARTSGPIVGVTIVIALLVALSFLHSRHTAEPESTAESTEATAPTAHKEGDTSVAENQSAKVVSQAEVLPADEQEFIRSVQSGHAAYSVAPNEMAKGGTRAERRAAICRSLSNGVLVSDWVGRIAELESNSDGKGVLEISIADSVAVKTYNNSFSDAGSDTLIDPTSPLFKRLSQMQKGNRVTFSGAFFASDIDCVQEASLTLEGSMTEPEFLFRFKTVEEHVPQAAATPSGSSAPPTPVATSVTVTADRPAHDWHVVSIEKVHYLPGWGGNPMYVRVVTVMNDSPEPAIFRGQIEFQNTDGVVQSRTIFMNDKNHNPAAAFTEQVPGNPLEAFSVQVPSESEGVLTGMPTIDHQSQRMVVKLCRLREASQDCASFDQDGKIPSVAQGGSAKPDSPDQQ